MSHFAPQSYRERGPVRPPDHPPMARLRRLGITRADEDAIYADYQAMTDAEKFDALERLDYLDDDELRQQIIEGRDERLASAAEHVTAEEADAAAIDPEDVPDGPVPAVTDWVGDDRRRAAAALIAEQRRHDPPRKTLVAALEDLLG